MQWHITMEFHSALEIVTMILGVRIRMASTLKFAHYGTTAENCTLFEAQNQQYVLESVVIKRQRASSLWSSTMTRILDLCAN